MSVLSLHTDGDWALKSTVHSCWFYVLSSSADTSSYKCGCSRTHVSAVIHQCTRVFYGTTCIVRRRRWEEVGLCDRAKLQRIFSGRRVVLRCRCGCVRGRRCKIDVVSERGWQAVRAARITRCRCRHALYRRCADSLSWPTHPRIITALYRPHTYRPHIATPRRCSA